MAKAPDVRVAVRHIGISVSDGHVSAARNGDEMKGNESPQQSYF